MRLRPEQLAKHLKQQLLPLYIVSGDEPLLLQEACDLIRAQAREQGCTEREIIDASVKGFDWRDILSSANNMSLFGDRKLIELRLPSGKPGKDGSKALCEYVEQSGELDVLLIVAGKIDKKSTNSKWFKALDKVGGVIQIWPVGAKELPRWLQQRVIQIGMSITDDALQLLSERVEGNLLAAVQEVEKLKLLANDSRITAQTVANAVSDNARYDIFGMVDSAISGNTTNSLRMLHGLRNEGTEPAVVLWALAREIRTLYEAQLICDTGQTVQQALNSLRVWNNRIPTMQSALSRHDLSSLTALLEQAATVDGSIKGYDEGKPWDNLESLVAGLSQ
ncbi:MAG: DNA polymerase III subunit delta [Halieaceae bacterium]|jgi:DNA polymerase III subunit delta|nr:DNA polymerase III subunit delta [Halieaceae bacterium]